jgi:hypothetical protein
MIRALATDEIEPVRRHLLPTQLAGRRAILEKNQLSTSVHWHATVRNPSRNLIA